MRHIIALGKIGELVQKSIEDRSSAGDDGKIRIINRGGRHVKVG